jgi:serine/threonine-protein kinase
LADRIARGPISLDEALPIARQIAEALEVAHEHGVVHRDLKPANIKLRADGTVKVLDFGLAKLAASEVGAGIHDSWTRMGVIAGTPAYMAPEQAAGKPVDKRADVWAFGVVLFEMLTGQRPFTGGTVSEVMGNVQRLDPDWTMLPAGTPQPVGRLLRRCLRKERKNRLRDLGDALADLDDALTTEPQSEGARTGVGPTIWRRALPVIATAIVVGLVVGLVTWRVPRTVAQPVSRLTFPVPAGLDPCCLVVAPDGRTIAFRGEPDQVYIRRLNQPDAVPIRGIKGTPVGFSPDSQWLLVEDRGLKKVPLDGDEATPITTLPPVPTAPGEARSAAVRMYGGASWGPQGTIVLATGEGGGLAVVPAS